MKPWQIYSAIVAITVPIIAGAWAFGETFGFRPAVLADVRKVESQVAGLDARQLTWQVESLKRQLYNANRYCRQGDPQACAHAREIAEQLRYAQARLRQIRGF